MNDTSSSRPGFGAQLRRNAVAIISLFLAIASLGYNTWRNERTEHQRNVRNAAFRVIEDLSALEETVFTLAWVREETRDPALEFAGWGKALAIRDVARLLPPPGPAEGEAVYADFRDHFPALAVAPGRPSANRAAAGAARDAMSARIEGARAVMIDIVRSLD